MTIKKSNRLEKSNTEEQVKKAPWKTPQLMSLEAEDTHAMKPSMASYENTPYGTPS